METRLTAALGASVRPPAHLTLSQRLCWVGRAELMLARGDGPAAGDLIEALNASLPNRGAWGTYEAPRMLYLRGMSRLLLKMPDDAENDLAQALTIARAQGARPAQVEILHGLARAARMRGVTGAEHRAAADRLAREMAATIPDAALRAGYEARVAREISELDT